MVRDVLLSWFRHGSSCFVMVMVRHGSVMVCDVSLSWFVMVRNVLLSWFCHGSSWFVMFYCHGFVMVRHGSCHGS